MHLWPVASMAPVSWTQMWALVAAITASYGRRKAAMAVALVWVPPTRMWTAASGRPMAARINAWAWAEWGSVE